jgi:hypothetical protein
MQTISVGVLEHVSEKSAHNSRTENCHPPETEAISAENLTKFLNSFVVGLHKVHDLWGTSHGTCFSLTKQISGVRRMVFKSFMHLRSITKKLHKF